MGADYCSLALCLLAAIYIYIYNDLILIICKSVYHELIEVVLFDNLFQPNYLI